MRRGKRTPEFLPLPVGWRVRLPAEMGAGGGEVLAVWHKLGMMFLWNIQGESEGSWF